MAAFRIFRRLAELLDVSIGTPTDGQVLTYVTADGKWEPADAVAGGGAPSGPAGGVLGGTYPDPSFAVDMATQGELDAAVSALSTVYQPLDSDLTAIAALTTTAFGRGLLALADAAALRISAGLGTAATSNTGDFDAAGAAAAAQAASQPLDSDLSAIAALSTTAFGRALLALADAAALRTAAGLGTAATANTGDFDAAGAAAAAQAASQPFDSELTALAGLVSAADALPYFTGSGTAAVTSLSSFIRTLLDDADAATALTTLGALAASALDTDGTLAANSDTHIPSQKAVKTYVDGHAGAADNASALIAMEVYS